MSIEDYDFKDIMVKGVNHANKAGVNIGLRCEASSVIIYKNDAIALAKHFKLTAEDINCERVKELRDELDEADEIHFDELAACKAQIADLNNRLKRVN